MLLRTSSSPNYLAGRGENTGRNQRPCHLDGVPTLSLDRLILMDIVVHLLGCRFDAIFMFGGTFDMSGVGGCLRSC